jgi:cysteine desulfurase
VALITGWFASETPLHSAAKMAIPPIFEQSWPGFTKLSAESRGLAILRNEALATIAGHVGVEPEWLHVLGEPGLGFYLGIQGLASPNRRLQVSAVDRQEVLAIANAHSEVDLLAVDSQGQIIQQPASDSILSWQLGNGETGVLQRTTPAASRIFVDATATGTRVQLPNKWSTALWDARSWSGPEGISVIAINPESQWRNPLPHNDNRVTPGGSAVGLLIASALAIDSWVADEKIQSTMIAQANRRIRGYIAERIPDVDFATPEEPGMPHLLSVSFLYVDGERLLNSLLAKGFVVDSGSACNAANLEPSHVLAAMGKLTQGNIRLTIHHTVTPDEVDGLIHAIEESVAELRD